MAPGFIELSQGALSTLRASYPSAMLSTLQGSTSNPEGVTSPEDLEQIVATFRTENGTGTIQGAAKGAVPSFGAIQYKVGIIVGGPRPLNWSSNGPPMTALQADAMVKDSGVNTPYTALTLMSDDIPSLGPLNTGVGWNHYLFTLLDGTASVSFDGSGQTSVQIQESHSSHTETHTESQSSEQFHSSETQSSEQTETSESISTSES